MQIKVEGHLDLDPNLILMNHGLEDGGRVQKYIDSEVIRLMDDYTPEDQGMLKAPLQALPLSPRCS